MPLRLSGTGVEQLLALAAALLIAPERQLVLIDEPQAYLHPHAERSLLSLLERHPEHQYIVATHSTLFLTAKPLTQTRLLTLDSQGTRVAQISGAEEVLAELGLTAADLWLADRLLWVEGPSEEGVLQTIADAELNDQDRLGLTIRAMPEAASRFASSSPKRAEAAHRFCTESIAAITPLNLDVRFLFDRDEKSEKLRDGISAASGGRAHFLPVRELENLFLSGDALELAIRDRCRLVEQSEPAPGAVARRLREVLDEHDDGALFPRGLSVGQDPVAVVKGSEVLKRLYWEFTTSDYDKVRDGIHLAEIVRQTCGAALDPLRAVLARVDENAPQSAASTAVI